MNIPGFTAEVSLKAFSIQHGAGRGSQGSVAAAVLPALNCQSLCRADCYEWWFDCHFECGGDQYCLFSCLNRNYYPCINYCMANCRSGGGAP